MYATYPIAGEVVAEVESLAERKAALKSRKTSLRGEKAEFRMTAKEMAQTRREVSQAKKTYAQAKQAARLDTRKQRIETKTSRDLPDSPAPTAASRTASMQRSPVITNRREAASSSSRTIIPDDDLADLPEGPAPAAPVPYRNIQRAQLPNIGPTATWFTDPNAQFAARTIWNASKVISAANANAILQTGLNGGDYEGQAELAIDDQDAARYVSDSIRAVAVGSPSNPPALQVMADRLKSGNIALAEVLAFWRAHRTAFPTVDYSKPATRPWERSSGFVVIGNIAEVGCWRY